jgi:hypothetical protein
VECGGSPPLSSELTGAWQGQRHSAYVASAIPYRPKTSAGATPLRPRTVASIFVFLFAGVPHPAVFQGAGFDLTYNVRDYL